MRGPSATERQVLRPVQFQPKDEAGSRVAVAAVVAAPEPHDPVGSAGKDTGKAVRVAYLINQYPSVSHTFIRREIRSLERQGIEVLRIGIRGWDAKLADAEDEAERRETRYVLQRGPLPLIAAALRRAWKEPRRFAGAFANALQLSGRSPRALPYHLIYLLEACLILEWLQAEQVDHLHAHFGTNPAEVALLVRLLGGPTYSFTVHGPDEFDSSPFLHLDRKIGGAKFVAAVNSYCRAQLFRRSVASDWGKIKIVHCGIEEAFHAGVTVPPSAERRLVCVGRLCEQKGQLILLEAFAKVSKALGDCRLVLAGDGEMRPEVERRIAELGLQESVTITGWIDSATVRQEILAARALVLPSFQESLPVVIMEALALGRPVVCTYVAGIPELVVHGKTGWIVPAGSLEPLVESLAECLNASPQLLQQLGDAGRERVLHRHSAEREAAKLARLFRATEVGRELEEWQP